MREILLSSQTKEKRKINLEKIRPGLSVAVRVKSQVYRGLVISFESESSLVRVKLVDSGRVADVQLEDISVMPHALRETNQVKVKVVTELQSSGFKGLNQSSESAFFSRAWTTRLTSFLILHSVMKLEKGVLCKDRIM